MGYVRLRLRSVYSKTVLYSAVRSLLSLVFCVFSNFAPIPMYRETFYDYTTLSVMLSDIRECGSTLYVGLAQGVSFSLYIGIGAKFENTQKTGERRLRTAEYRTVLL